MSSRSREARTRAVLEALFELLSIATFRVDATNDVPTKQLLTNILERGRIHLSSTRLNGELWLRLCVLSFLSVNVLEHRIYDTVLSKAIEFI